MKREMKYCGLEWDTATNKKIYTNNGNNTGYFETGKGLTVIDIDSLKLPKELKPVLGKLKPTTKTKRGTHYYFTHSKELNYKNKAKLGKNENIDIRGEGGKVFVKYTGDSEYISYDHDTNNIYNLSDHPMVKHYLDDKAVNKHTSKENIHDESIGDMSIEEVKELLDKVDVKNYYTRDPWIGMIASIYKCGGEKVEDIAREWSQGDAEQYDEKSFDHIWQQCVNGKYGDSYSKGTLIHAANGEKKDPASIFKKEKGSVKNKKKKRKNKSRIIPSSKFIKQYKNAKWLIKGVLPNAELGELFGASMSRKTFMVLDIGTCIHNGINWHGHTTYKSNVLYVVGEGVNGVRNRLSAFANQYEVDECMDILPTSVDMISSKGMEELSKDIELLKKDYGLIIVDTLNGNSSGDEDSAKDFALMKKNLQNTIAKEDRLIMWVHHTGNSEGNRGRGSSARFAGIDVSIKVTATEKISILSNTKQKDAELFKDMEFSFESIKTGFVDEEMHPMYSLVPKFDGYLTKENSEKSFKNNDGMMSIIKEIINDQKFEIVDEVNDIIKIEKSELRTMSKETIFKGQKNYRTPLNRWYKDALKHNVILNNETECITLKRSSA